MPDDGKAPDKVDMNSTSGTAPKKPKLAKARLTFKEQLLDAYNRGGLVEPTYECYTICCLAFLYFEQFKATDIVKDFMKCANQRRVFLSSVTHHMQEDPSFACLVDLSCANCHEIVPNILSCIFNCFATNLRRSLFTDGLAVAPGADRKIRKLQSKGSTKQ